VDKNRNKLALHKELNFFPEKSGIKLMQLAGFKGIKNKPLT
jgi:hypothetical protein